MDGPKRSKAAAADGGFPIPDDPLVEILSRLPAKPLFRSKCVSTGWCRLIADRLGRRKFPQTLEGFFVGGGGGGGGGLNDWRFINLSGKSAPLVDASFSFLAKLPGSKQIKLLSAHNGLLLFVRFLDCSRYEYIVCNPATEQWMHVPGPGFTPRPWAELASEFDSKVKCLLIFDPAVSSHFCLLQFRHDNGIRLVKSVCVFSSEDGVWRDSTMEWIQCEEPVTFAEVPSKLGCADVNGMLHVPFYRHELTSSSHTNDIQIAVLDMQGEKFLAIHWPDTDKFDAAAFVGQSQGHLHCITAHEKQEGHLVRITGLSIWVLEDYDAAQWVLKRSVSCSQLFGEISCGVDDFDVVAIHPDRSLVFFVHRCSWKLMSYDMDSEEGCDLCTLEHGCGPVTPYVPYFADVPILTGRASADFLEGQPTTV